MRGRRALASSRAVCVFALLVGILAAPAPAGSVSPPATPVRLGVSVPNVPYDFTALDQFETSAGQRVSLVSYFASFLDSDFNRTGAQAIRARGAIPMMTWEPWDYTGTVNQPAYRLARIIDGSFDSYVTRWAQQIRDWAEPIYLRFAHEMNGNWYPWAERANGNQPGEYALAWRHVRALFRAAGASNVTWVWSPNAEFPGSTPLTGLYPGNGEVDVIGVDGFNAGTAAGGSWWTFDQIFGSTLTAVRGLGAKPLIIAETASAEAGGDKAAWIRGLFAGVAANPDISAVVWFNFDKEADWRIESSSTATQAFAAGVAAAIMAPSKTYVPLVPTRILDTRNAGKSGRVGASPVEVAVAGVGGLPRAGVEAVVLNVTVVKPTDAGFLTVFPSGSPVPATSNLNFDGGDTVGNAVFARLGDGGRVAIINGTGLTHVVVDVLGWMPRVNAAYTPVGPTRLLDTRSSAAIGPGQSLRLRVAGIPGLVPAGAAAVAINMVAIAPKESGYLTVYPSDLPAPPLASSLNFGDGRIVASLVVAKVGTNGEIAIYNSSGRTHVVADLAGWFAAGSALPVGFGGFSAIDPLRLVDTRNGTGAAPRPIGPGETLRLNVTRLGVPAGAAAVAFRVAAVAPTSSGYLTVFPGDLATPPLASNLNFSKRQVIANLAVVRISPAGEVAIFNSAGNTHVVVDLAGWFSQAT